MRILNKVLIMLFTACFVSSLLPVAALAEGVYLVEFDSQGGSEVESTTVEDGAFVIPPHEPIKDGFEFAGWYREPGCTNKWLFESDTVTLDIVLYASWQPDPDIATVTITGVSEASSCGTVIGGGEYSIGDTVTLTAIPKEGFRFVRWMEVETSSQYSFEAQQDQKLTAEFASIGAPSLSVQSISFNKIKLSWTAVEGAAGYEIYRATQKYGTYAHKATVSDTGYTNGGLTAGKTYYYRIRAYCVSDETITYGPLTAASGTPDGVAVAAVAVSVGCHNIQVSWNPVSGASGYEIYRSTTKHGTYSKVFTASSKALSFTNTGLVINKSYYYKLRAFCNVGNSIVYAAFSGTVSAAPLIVAPGLSVVPVSLNKNRLSWSVQTGISGYEIYRATAKYGTYKKIFTATDWPTAIYTNTGLTTNKTYYYKIRAFGVTGGTIAYGAWSSIQSSAPSAAAALAFKERSYTIYYQGDPKWGFSSSVKSTACVLTAYAITINNMGISATPRTVYDSNGKRTQMNMTNLRKNFGVVAVCALRPDSEYLYRFDGHKTYIVKPSSNAEAAIKEALNIHPEGVILYFKSGSRAHAIVACKYDGNTICFSDPGRNKSSLLVFKDTWVSYHHHMTYANLAEMIALDN